jgi:hypothetical protein
VLADPTRFAGGEAVLPIRLKNVGTPIHAPLRLVLRRFGSGLGGELQEYAPEVLNAANRVTGEGAIFDFTPAIGSGGILPPGAMTGAVEIRVKVKDPLRVPDMHVSVTGRQPN